jgi:hypothetical protein
MLQRLKFNEISIFKNSKLAFISIYLHLKMHDFILHVLCTHLKIRFK